MTRGVKHARDLFVSQMQSHFFNWKRKNLKTKKQEITAVQGALRPIELWEYVFPEEALPEVKAMLGITEDRKDYALSRLKTKILQKALGCKDVPKTKQVPNYRPMISKGVSSHIIGVKKDKRGKFMGYDQELL
jgi:hypothetical protein